MNNSIRNIFKFLRITRRTVEEFEQTVGLQSGTLNDNTILQYGLSREDTHKVLHAYREEWSDQGYIFIDTTGFDQRDLTKGDIVISYQWEEKDNPYEKDSEAWTNWLIDHHIKCDTIDRIHQKKVVIQNVHFCDSIMLMNWDDFKEIVNTENYRNRGIINGTYVFEYLTNPQVNLETTVYFNPDGTVDDVLWSFQKEVF